MKILKNNSKLVIGFIVGVILASGIVYAATSASQVSYTTDTDIEIKNVEDALNDLYKNKTKNEKLVRTVIKQIKYDPEASDWANEEYSERGYGSVKVSARNIPNYDKLTKENFTIELNTIHAGISSNSNINNDGVNATISSYENGILTINIPRFYRNNSSFAWLELSVVAYYIDYE